MEPGRILYALRGRVAVLKLVGDVRSTAMGSLCSPVDLSAYLDALLARDDVDEIVIDLSETEGIDSTHLGLLAQAAVHQRKRGGGRAVIWSPREKITRTLRSMGFHTLFTIAAALADVPECTERLPSAEGAQGDGARVILDAHKALAAMNEENAVQFHDLISLLERERSG